MAKKNNPLTRCIAFLRAINVGGRRVKMEQLRSHFEELSFPNVSTFIASGNVIFDAPSSSVTGLESRIEAHLAKSLGFEVETFIRTPADLQKTIEIQAFSAEDVAAEDHTVHVVFLRDKLSAANEHVVATFQTEMDEFAVHGRELIWLCRGRLTESRVSWPRLTKAIGTPSTARNVVMLRKVLALKELS